MLCKNISGGEVNFHIDRLPGQTPMVYKVQPGEEVEIEDGYCVPYMTENKRVLPALITQITMRGETVTMEPTGRYSPGIVRGQLPKGAIFDDAKSAAPPELLSLLATMQAQLAAMQNTQAILAQQNIELAARLATPAPAAATTVPAPAAAPAAIVPGSVEDRFDLDDFIEAEAEVVAAVGEHATAAPSPIQAAAAKQALAKAAKAANSKSEAAK
jgi:hypothetical protein